MWSPKRNSRLRIQDHTILPYPRQDHRKSGPSASVEAHPAPCHPTVIFNPSHIHVTLTSVLGSSAAVHTTCPAHACHRDSQTEAWTGQGIKRRQRLDHVQEGRRRLASTPCVPHGGSLLWSVRCRTRWCLQSWDLRDLHCATIVFWARPPSGSFSGWMFSGDSPHPAPAGLPIKGRVAPRLPPLPPHPQL